MNGANPNIFPLTCRDLGLPQPLIGLELLPNIARLCRRKLDVLLGKLVVYYQQMDTITFQFDCYVGQRECDREANANSHGKEL